MNQIKKIMVFILMSSLFLYSDSVDIEPLPKNVSVQKALFINCLSRTQTQQLLRLYIMKGMKNRYKDPGKMLEEALPKFDKRFNDLDTFFRSKITDPEYVGYMDKSKELWKKAKKILEQEPSKENALILYNDFNELIKYLGKVKVLTKQNFKTIGLTGGLCRIPMYLSSMYMLKTWGVEMPQYKEISDKHFKKFNENISQLENFDKNTDEINEYIRKSKEAFRFFELTYETGASKMLTLMSKKADDIFLYIRTTKQLYGKIILK